MKKSSQWILLLLVIQILCNHTGDIDNDTNQTLDLPSGIDKQAIDESRKVLIKKDKFSAQTPVLLFTTETFIQSRIGTIFIKIKGFQKQLDKPYLVMFYAPWCGHCKKIIALWESLAEYQNHTIIAAVDCEAHRELKERFVIKGFPTILYFRDTNQITFKGERNFLDLEKFIREDYKSQPTQLIPQKADSMRQLKQQFSQPSVLVNNLKYKQQIAMGVLSIFTILLFVFCIFDYKESLKLKELEIEREIKRRDEIKEKQEVLQTVQQNGKEKID